MEIIVYALVFVLSINLAAFFWAFARQSDKLTDLTYSMSFFLLALDIFFAGTRNSWAAIFTKTVFATSENSAYVTPCLSRILISGRSSFE